jgi:hypothetical protein
MTDCRYAHRLKTREMVTVPLYVEGTPLDRYGRGEPSSDGRFAGSAFSFA